MKFGSMHPRVRARGGAPTQDPRQKAVEGWLDALTVRLRGPEITWLAARLESPEAAAALPTLAAAGNACRGARDELLKRADALRTYATAADARTLGEVVARHIRVTVKDPAAAKLDIAAIARGLDVDALLEREAGFVEEQGARLEVVVRALGGLLARGEGAEREVLDAVRMLREVTESEPRAATRRAAVRALAGAIARVPGDLSALNTLSRLVREPEEDPWVRRGALDVVKGFAPDAAVQWLGQAMLAAGKDAFLVRARAVELLLDHAEGLSHRASAALDPSELVRATLIDGLGRRAAGGDAPALHLLAQLRAADPEPRVRARAAHALAGAGTPGLALLVDALGDEPLVVSFALDAAYEAVRGGANLPATLGAALEALRSSGGPGTARAAGRVLLCARLAGTAILPLAEELAALPPGGTRTVAVPPRDLWALADALAVFAYDGFGFHLEPTARGVRVTRDDVHRPRLWRLLHELRNPAPAKRQGHAHTLGRTDMGAIRVPPGGLAEESATGVPGERLLSEREEGWAPALPMVDDYLDALGRAEVRIVTTEGVTRVRPPATWFGRLRARVALTWRYARFDALRTAVVQEPEEKERGRYTRSLADLGYETAQESAGSGASRPYFRRTFLDPIAFSLGTAGSSLVHLLIVVLLVSAWMFARAALARRTLRQARSQLKLVIGGWGTRGKSGTERLKAGLFEGLGVPFVSKTTGCEAMLLHGPPGGHAFELFLFRPFDKATIWEQVNVVRFGANVGARAFLWECMGLNPIYVDLLQSGWMRDDLSTLTNAYPDHEDIQGPTGMDVARVIGGFASPDALVVTAERNMRPVLAEQARMRGTRLEGVSRVDAELLPRDLLGRMPHAEHPSNAALAANAAAALGVDKVDALGLMAEHVVPDLGALMISPEVGHMGRTVIFANGMSANDPLSFRHNWRRTGFADHDHHASASTFLVTVVNNRADRVTRSRVFAQILAADAPAHRHVFIGTNLRGLLRYFEEALDQRLENYTLDGDPARVASLFEHLRLVDPARLGAECASRCGAPPDAIRAWVDAVRSTAVPGPTLAAARAAAADARPAADALEAACTERAGGLADHLIEALARALAGLAARTAPANQVRALYKDLALASVVLVEDPSASGDKIIARALATAPPGAHVRLMGVQNIKGTGLDFAYQWVWWRELHTHLEELAFADPLRRARALAGIEANALGTVFACDAVLRALPALAEVPDLAVRVATLTRKAQARRAALLAARAGSAPAAQQNVVTRLLERIADPFDAILRRRRADRIFADLETQRISHPRAQAELRALTERQKGGWLKLA